MTEVLISAAASIVVGLLALAGVMITNKTANDKIITDQRENQAVYEHKVDELTREVREHNSMFARIPVIEEKLAVANHRIEDLEKKVG